RSSARCANASARPDGRFMAEANVPRSEPLIVFLVGAIQFVNIVDFMMVMPLGPYYAQALGISTAHLGQIAGSYTAAAAIAGTGPKLSSLLADRTIRLALAMNGLVMLTAFLVVPNIAPHLLQNLGFPRDRLDLGYMLGGASSFLIMRIAGRGIDRYGAARVSIVGTALMIGVLPFAFIAPGAIGI